MTDHGAMEFHRFHQTEAGLVTEFQHWCDSEGLPQMSADELLHEDITTLQRSYLQNFLARWNAVVNRA